MRHEKVSQIANGEDDASGDNIEADTLEEDAEVASGVKALRSAGRTGCDRDYICQDIEKENERQSKKKLSASLNAAVMGNPSPNLKQSCARR